MTDQTTNTPPAIPPAIPPEPSGYESMEGETSLSNVLNKLLKRPLSLIHHLEHGEQSSPLSGKLVAISAICLVVFGLVVGSFSAGTQLWAAPVKILGGLLFSALICLPSLYIFTCLGGLDAKFRTVAGLLCSMIALAALLLVTLQMPTTLRPIIGTSDRILNLEEKRFFLQYWSEQLSGDDDVARTAQREASEGDGENPRHSR